MIYSMLKLRNFKVAITQLAMDLQALKIHHDTVYQKVGEQHIDKNPVFNSF